MFIKTYENESKKEKDETTFKCYLFKFVHDKYLQMIGLKMPQKLLTIEICHGQIVTGAPLSSYMS